MPRVQGPRHFNFPLFPVDPRIILCEPRISEDDVVLASQVDDVEGLGQVPFFDSQGEHDLVMDHPSGVHCSIHVPRIHWLGEFFQWPFHPSDEVEVYAAYCGPTIDEGGHFSNFSVFQLVKYDRDSD